MWQAVEGDLQFAATVLPFYCTAFFHHCALFSIFGLDLWVYIWRGLLLCTPNITIIAFNSVSKWLPNMYKINIHIKFWWFSMFHSFRCIRHQQITTTSIATWDTDKRRQPISTTSIFHSTTASSFFRSYFFWFRSPDKCMGKPIGRQSMNTGKRTLWTEKRQL